MEIHSHTEDVERVARAVRELEAALRGWVRRPAEPEGAADALCTEAEHAFDEGRTEEALGLAARALDLDPPRKLRARAHHLRGRIGTLHGPPLAAHELLLTEAGAVASIDPERASRMLSDAAFAAIAAGDAELAQSTAERAARTAPSPGAKTGARLLLGIALLIGTDAASGERITRAALGSASAGDDDAWLPQAIVLALFWLHEYGAAERFLAALIDRARHDGDARLAQWLDTRGSIYARAGRYGAAEASSLEALRIARSQEQWSQAASCLTTLAGIAARRGRASDCRRYADEAVDLDEGNEFVFAWATCALALLELGDGNVEAATTRLEAMFASPIGEIRRDPAILQGAANLVEAYVAASRPADARIALAQLEDKVATEPTADSAAAIDRCLGLVSHASEFDDHFERALDRHRTLGVPFERARTELAYGQRLRRSRRRAAARSHLSAALGTFEQLGARSWAERARRELAATRGRARGGGDATHVLTPHELEIAAHVQRGLSNRQIAEALFVSERTVEYHLTNIYRKLELRSRTQLARFLAQ